MGKLCSSVSSLILLGAICATVFGVFYGCSNGYRHAFKYYKLEKPWNNGIAEGFSELSFAFKSSNFNSDAETAFIAQNGSGVWERLPIMNHFYSLEMSFEKPFIFSTSRSGYDSSYPDYELAKMLANPGEVFYSDFKINNQEIPLQAYSTEIKGECPSIDNATSTDDFTSCLHIDSWVYVYFVFDKEGNYVENLYKQTTQLPIPYNATLAATFAKTANFKGGVVCDEDPGYILAKHDIDVIPARWKMILVVIVCPILAAFFFAIAVIVGFFKCLKKCCCCCCRRKRSMA